LRDVFLGTAFGLLIESGRAFQELAPATGPVESGCERVRIEWKPRAPLPEAARTRLGGLFEATPDSFALNVPGVARYVVNSQSIEVHPSTDADDQSIRAFLFGSAVGALLHMRGLTVLHGSAVVTPGGEAAVFCGMTTAGKSTLAAGLAARGHPLLADDIAALSQGPDGRTWVQPGLARTKLWRHSLESLALSGLASAENQVRPGIDKYALQLPMAIAPAPLRWIYELHAREQGELTIEPIAGLARINALVTHTFRPRYVLALGRQPQQLRRAAQLAPQVDMWRIERPRREATLDAIVERLERAWSR
jgi:hypothetical protein